MTFQNKTYPTKKTRKHLKIFISTLLFFGIASFVFVVYLFQKNASKNYTLKSLVYSKNWSKSNLNTNAGSQIHDFGAKGIYRLENLFFNGKSYNYLSDDDQFSEVLATNGTYPYHFSPLADNPLKNNSKVLKANGTTLIFSSSDEMKSMQGHYFHFCEEFLLTWAAFNRFNMKDVQTIIFPNINSWQGRVNSINAVILKSFFPNAQIIGKNELQQISKKYLLHFEDTLFVDRHSCHQNADNNTFNKMLFAHKDLIKPSDMESFKETLYSKLRTYAQPAKKPYITYIKRTSLYRFLEPSVEKKLLENLAQKFPEYTIYPVWFEHLSFAQQIQVIRNTKVLIGVHGNGLTHELFLPKDSTVIEIFPKGAYTMDYQLFAELGGHHYYGISSDEGLVATSGKYMPVRGNLNQMVNNLDVDLVTSLIQRNNQISELPKN